MNTTHLIGNCGADPEVKQVNETLKVAKVSIGISEKDKTEWVNLVAFNKTAELFENYVKKGDKIRVTGKLQTRSWEKDGVKHYSTEVLVNELEFLTPKSQ